MTVEEKVGQLLMVGFAGTQVNDQVRLWVEQRHVGGVALFSRNIVDFAQTAKFTRDIRALSSSKIPVFVALDQEGGNVVRIRDGALELPGNMALGATRDPMLAYVAGQGLAVDLHTLGFNMNLAPVLDVNSNPNNPVIGVRSYGERPELVGQMGAWYIRGQQEMGVVAVAKHFPGHGDTQSDSHFSMPSISADYARLEKMELAPFKQAVDAGLDAIMTAHLALPKIAETPTLPATLSARMLSDILRRRLGFNGIIITDGLEMQGITDAYGCGRAAVLAILAGADMPMVLWTSETRESVYRSLLQAVKSGEITRERLDQSLRRILSVKLRRHMFTDRLESLETVLAARNTNPTHDQVAERIAQQAVTLVRDNGNWLPLHPSEENTAVVLAPPGAFGETIGKVAGVSKIVMPVVPSRARRRQDAMAAVAAGRHAQVLVAAVSNRYHLETLLLVMRELPQLPVVLVSFASPYYLRYVPRAQAYVCTYSYLEDAQKAAAQALLGEFRMTGRLPVTIPGFYRYGHRLDDHMAHADVDSARVVQ